MKNCPICGKEVTAYHEVTFTEPYTHTNGYDGMHIYGAYSSPKETICYENNFLHFAFYDAEGNLVNDRLVQLGVANPQTKSLSQMCFEETGSSIDSFSEDYEEDDEDFYVEFGDEDDGEEESAF